MTTQALEIFTNRSEFWKTRVSVDLSNLTDLDSIQKIAEVMLDTTEMDEVREAGGGALGRIGTDDTIGILEKVIYKSTEELAQVLAMIGLSVTSHPRANIIMLDVLKNENTSSRIRRSACYTLANRQVDAVIPLAIQYIDEPFVIEDTFLGGNIAIESLLKFDISDTINVIIDWSIKAIYDEVLTPIQREHAANYVARLADKQHEHILIKVIDHPFVKSKRLYAGKSGNHIIEALKRIGSSTAMNAVSEWENNQV